MRKSCSNCLNHARLKSYENEGKDPNTHCRCSKDGSIHRKNKEQRHCSAWHAEFVADAQKE